MLYKTAWYLWRMGKGVDAERLALQSMNVRTRVLGQEHDETLNSMGMLGLVYNLRDRLDAAAELQVQVMETWKRKLGTDHPSTLHSIQ